MVSAILGVMMRSMVGSLARLRKRVTRSSAPFSSKSCRKRKAREEGYTLVLNHKNLSHLGYSSAAGYPRLRGPASASAARLRLAILSEAKSTLVLRGVSIPIPISIYIGQDEEEGDTLESAVLLDILKRNEQEKGVRSAGRMHYPRCSYMYLGQVEEERDTVGLTRARRFTRNPVGKRKRACYLCRSAHGGLTIPVGGDAGDNRGGWAEDVVVLSRRSPHRLAATQDIHDAVCSSEGTPDQAMECEERLPEASLGGRGAAG